MKRISYFILPFFLIISCKGAQDQTQSGAQKEQILSENQKGLDELIQLALAEGDSASEELLGVKVEVDKNEKRKKIKEQLIEEFDKDGDGKLNKEEIIVAKAAIKENAKKRKKEIKKNIIAKNDLDGDGELSANEKQEFLEKKVNEHKEKRENVRKALNDKCGILKDELKDLAELRQELQEQIQEQVAEQLGKTKQQREEIAKMIEEFKASIDIFKEGDMSAKEIKDQMIKFHEEAKTEIEGIKVEHQEVFKQLKEQIAKEREEILTQHVELFKCHKDALVELKKQESGTKPQGEKEKKIEKDKEFEKAKNPNKVKEKEHQQESEDK